MLKQSLFLAAFLFVLHTTHAFAQPGRTPRTDGHAKRPSVWTSARADNAVEEAVASGRKTRVILRYRAGARGRLGTWLNGTKQHTMRGEARTLNTIALELPASLVQQLSEHADTVGISIDAEVRTTQVTDPAAYRTESRRAATSNVDGQQLRATLGVRTSDIGLGVGVAIIDSGIAPTRDLAGRITAFYDFTGDGWAIAATPSDEYGHGTHIAGLIAGSGTRSNGKFVGVARAARLIGLKVLDSQGAGYTSDVIEAIEFATANKAALGIDVVNLSLGHPVYEPAATDPLVQAVERAVRAGIVVVVSAGNIGMNPTTAEIGFAGITSPGNAPSALTVGSLRHRGTATRLDDRVSPFSSRGPTRYDGFAKPDILAPGQALVATAHASSSLYRKSELRVDNPDYVRLSGTSMAAAVASGVVANMIAANRRDEGPSSVLTPNTVKAILQFTAIPVPGHAPSRRRSSRVRAASTPRAPSG